MAVPWPATLSWPIKVVDWFWSTASSHVLSIECLLQSTASSIPLAMRKTLVDLCVPLLLLLLLIWLEAATALCARCAAVRRRRRSRYAPPPARPAPLRQLVRVLVVWLFVYFPFLVRTVLGMFACKALDAGAAGPGEQLGARGSFWMSDMNQHCYQGYHSAWAYALGVPLASLLCAALPAFVFAYTRRRRTGASEQRFQQHFSFVTRSYKPAYVWWQAVVLVETVLLCLAAAYAAMLGPYYQGLLMLAAFALMFVLVLLVRPHAQPFVTRVVLQGYATLFITAYLILTFLPLDGAAAPPRQYGLAAGVLLLALNVAYPGYCIACLLLTINWKAARDSGAAVASSVASKARTTTMLAVSSVLSSLRSSSSGDRTAAAAAAAATASAAGAKQQQAAARALECERGGGGGGGAAGS
jgi:hypothetical protein